MRDIRRAIAARWLERAGEFRDVTRASASAVDLAVPITTRDRYLQTVRREIAFFRKEPNRKTSRAWFDSLAGSPGSSMSVADAVCR